MTSFCCPAKLGRLALAVQRLPAKIFPATLRASAAIRALASSVLSAVGGVTTAIAAVAAWTAVADVPIAADVPAVGPGSNPPGQRGRGINAVNQGALPVHRARPHSFSKWLPP